MKRIKFTLQTILCLTLSCSMQSIAQTTPAYIFETLDINQIKATHALCGDMWYQVDSVGVPGHGSPKAGLEYPKGSGKHAGFLGGVWIGGFDRTGQLKAATTMYRINGTDFYPGPLDALGICDSNNSKKWNRFWKVDQATIAAFVKYFGSGGASAITDPKYNVIKEWPAAGNTSAVGATGSALSELLSAPDPQYYAPFVDVNADGKYNWKDGDYPKIKGDQMIWWIFNDNTGFHAVSKSTPLKMEIHASAYAYSRVSSVDRMLFYEFDMHNKGTGIDSFVFSLFCDADLGNPFDDALAIDSNRRMMVEFNPSGDGPDGLNSYGKNSPLAAVTYLEMPSDNYPSAMQKIGSFGYFQGVATGSSRDPRNLTEFYNYMTGSNADGGPLGYYNGHTPDPMFQQLYNITSGGNPCDTLSAPYMDRRYILSTKAFYGFESGTKKKVALAFIVTDTTSHICPDLKTKEISDLADTALVVYYHPLPLGIKESVTEKGSLNVYPNPAQTTLYVTTDNTLNKDAYIHIVDALGRTLSAPFVKNINGFELNISGLASGLYSIVLNDGTEIVSQRFEKK